MSICCSSRTSGITARLSERLERNLGIQTLRIEVDDAPVSETWEEGAGADALLILLDRTTAPPPMKREDWTGLIDHDGTPPLAFVRLEDCAYPKLLDRRPFFPPDDPVLLDRAVERWLTALLPKRPGIAPAPFNAPFPPEWWERLADAPGCLETGDIGAAQAFARHARGHYQSVVWIGCSHREAALIRAELEHRTPAGRSLVILAHLAKPLSLPGGRHSYIQVIGPLPETSACYGPCFPGWLAKELDLDLSTAIPLDETNALYRWTAPPEETPEIRQRHLEILQRHFQSWRETPDTCRLLLTEVPRAITYGFAHDWSNGVALCRRAAFLLLAEGRRREGIRMLHRLLVEAEAHGDSEAAAEALHELSWLTDEDAPARPAIAEVQQLDLFA